MDNDPDRQQIGVLLFAGARDLAKTDQVVMDITLPTTILEIRKRLSLLVPGLVPLLESSRFAVNDTYVDENFVVSRKDEVALVPPVSGG